MERELWLALYFLARRLDKPWGNWLYSASDILATYFWAVVHDRPMLWATQSANWPDDLRPKWLPSQDRLSVRMRQADTVELMLAVEQHLLSLLAFGNLLLKNIDGKGLVISDISRDPDAGYGHAAGKLRKGYKLHAVWTAGPMPLAWALAPMHVSEKTMARDLLRDLPGSGYVLGDVQYDVGYLYDIAAQAGHQLLATKTKGRGRGCLGHRRQSPARLRCIELLRKRFGRAVYCYRRTIEGRFGTLSCWGGGLCSLPAWTRRFPRVRNWVHAKLLISGTRWLLRHDPKRLALA